MRLFLVEMRDHVTGEGVKFSWVAQSESQCHREVLIAKPNHSLLRIVLAFDGGA